MKVTGAKVRCDGCGRVALEKSPEAKTFKGFYMPPSISTVTGEPDGKFDGIARAGSPDQLAHLHACPGCQPKIRAMKMGGDIASLPDGPLKKILRQLTRERILKLH